MVHPLMASSPLRASRLVLVPCLILAGLSGCSHKRSVMRPVYGTPVQAASPGCTTPGCTTGGAVITAPSAADEPFASPDTTISAPPAASASDYDPVVPARISPPVPGDAGEREPGLNLKYSDPKAPTSSSIDDGPMPELTRPNASRPTPRRTTRSGNRLSPVSLREAVRPFVDNPDDLFQPPKADRPWRYVVLHHSAGATGGYDQIDREHRKTLGWNGCGYHFVIGNGTDTPDGQIEVAQRWVDQKNGVHCRDGKNPDVNEYGIGICLVGNFDQAPPTPKQIASARSLIAYLGSRYQIPADHIDTHSDLAAGPTACPGKFFPSLASL
ncbi:N-acetylmuramoyl-L-alanine amidase [Tundrisphaera sp. TA3]|uniref:peptidoglycan recognition protein family protein n=1 Tax=Tundrisphaera sp. TA3 TaxID=3435775 RepID=UPI003EBABC31